jgi:hypothetical protein
MNANCNSHTFEAETQNSSAAPNAENAAPDWFAVRPALLITLTILVALLGVVVWCPSLIDQTLVAVR